MIGETISHFRILEKIDEGGMGVIYKARDEKLHRDVAIKILAPKLVEDQDMRDRFLREARSAAAMAHPNIAIIYEVDEADRGIFIAMELVEGETLEAILNRSGSLPLGNLLDLAIQTVEGLAEAHSRKIIHMDLKPQNLMVTPGGRVKILDFGLARPFREEATAGTEAVDAETVILDSPNNRRISGTIQYMSPEQSLGIPVDARSDLFTFGTMLYEMSTGRKPFQGGSVTSTIAKILEADPDPFSRVKADLPVGLERIVLKCLEKKPAARYQKATDLLEDLKRIHRSPATGSNQESGATGTVKPAKRPRSAEEIAISATTIAVFPFSVRGHGEFAYLGDGMADILTTKLHGAGELRCVDAHLILASAAREMGTVPTPDRAREIARRFGAGLFVLGNVLEIGGQLHLEASLYESGSSTASVAQASAQGDAGLIFTMVDALTADLLAGRCGGPGARLTRIAAIIVFRSWKSTRARGAGSNPYIYPTRRGMRRDLLGCASDPWLRLLLVQKMIQKQNLGGSVARQGRVPEHHWTLPGRTVI